MNSHELAGASAVGNKLRTARNERNFSLRELAEMADVSASLLSQIENGKINPTVRSLHSIAEALSVPVNYFFPGEDENNTAPVTEGTGVDPTVSDLKAIQGAVITDNVGNVVERKIRALKGPVVRALARTTIQLQGNITWSRLTPDAEEGIEFLQIFYDVGASSGERLSRHAGREFGLILTGELLVELGFDSHHLKPGDTIIFDSETPHRLSNAGDVPVQAVWVIFNRYP